MMRVRAAGALGLDPPTGHGGGRAPGKRRPETAALDRREVIAAGRPVFDRGDHTRTA